MWWGGWVNAAIDVWLIGIGAVTAFSRVLPEPEWLWGRRDPVTGAPTPGVRATGLGTMALGAALLAWFAPAGAQPWGVGVGLLFFVASFTFHLRARRLTKA